MYTIHVHLHNTREINCQYVKLRQKALTHVLLSLKYWT